MSGFVRHTARFLRGFSAVFALLATQLAGAFTLGLESSAPGLQAVGTQITLSAVISGDASSRVIYQFSHLDTKGNLRIVRDFSPRGTLDWSSLDEGVHAVAVVAFDPQNLELRSAVLPLLMATRITDGTPVVAPTRHPLVALYSAPPCPTGMMRVRFRHSLGGPETVTPPKACEPGRSVNFHIAGMAPQNLYVLESEWVIGSTVIKSEPLFFETGTPPVDYGQDTITLGSNFDTALQEPILLINENATRSFVATNVWGDLVWYLNENLVGQSMQGATLTRPVDGGKLLMLLREDINDVTYKGQTVREVDLIGNVVRETNVQRVNAQLREIGQDIIGSFHHEALRLPNGHTAVLTSIEQLLTDVQGEGEVDVIADGVVVLDGNMQVVWSWSGFDHLDVTEQAILNETCESQAAGCPPVFLAEIANDWTHGNAIAYSPADGNLVLSMRHLDAAFKIDYRNGAGNGAVVWRFGEGGDFALAADDPWPWFSHQHDVHYEGPLLVLYDNGVVRRQQLGDSQNSRGQVYVVDEAKRQAVLFHNFDLGGYAAAVGNGELLSNGNYHFNNGFLNGGQAHESLELLPNGERNWVIGGNGLTYRSFRLKTMYLP